ncbi:MAG: XRE family transcriptional regulator [Muribaculaceae bacterium]|nr:XRE family transcriptional regulator [Muribaculaceae bacterium]
MDILSRLQAVVSYSKTSDRAFALKCGIKQSTLDKQLKGVRSVSLETITAVAKCYPEISADWLLLGEGEMLRNASKSEERINMMLDTITLLQGTINSKDEAIKALMKRVEELENSK